MTSSLACYELDFDGEVVKLCRGSFYSNFRVLDRMSGIFIYLPLAICGFGFLYAAFALAEPGKPFGLFFYCVILAFASILMFEQAFFLKHYKTVKEMRMQFDKALALLENNSDASRIEVMKEYVSEFSFDEGYYIFGESLYIFKKYYP